MSQSSSTGIESQKPVSAKITTTTSGNNKNALILGGLVGFGVIAGSTAYGLGLFESEKEKQSKSKPEKVKKPQQQPSMSIDPMMTTDEFNYLHRMEKSKLSEGLRRLKDDDVEEQLFAKGLKRDSSLDPQFCERIAKILSEQGKYNLSQTEMEIINHLDAECKKKSPEVEVAETPKDPGPVIPEENKVDEPPKPEPSNTDPKPEDPHSDDSSSSTEDPCEYAAIITILKIPTPSLETLLQNAEALAAFKELNQLDAAERFVKLGKKQAIADAFNQLLDLHIKETKKRELLSDDLRDILKLASNKSAELGLKKGQVADISNALKKPLESDVKYLEDAPNQPLDLDNSQRANLETAALYKIKCCIKKITQASTMLTLDDFLGVYNTQLKMGFNACLKIAEPTVGDSILARCDDALKNAIIAANANAEEYLKIYHSYRGVQDLVTRSEQAGKAINYVCAKAIINQATQLNEFFGKNSYQALCVALSSHNLLRGELKNLGVDAGPAAAKIEQATTFKSLLMYEMNFFSYWDEKKMLQFTNAIEQADQSMSAEMKSTQADMNAYLQKHRVFVVKLEYFLRSIHFLYQRMRDDTHMDRVASALGKACAWLRRIDSYFEITGGLPNPGNYGNLIIAAVNQDISAFISAINGESVKANFAEIVAYTEAVKQRTSADIIENATWGVITKYANFRDAIFNIASDSAKRCLTLNITAQKVAYLTCLDTAVSAFMDELSSNTTLRRSVTELCASTLAQFNSSVEKPGADMTTEIQVHAKRAEFLYKLRTDASAYRNKLQDLATALYNSLTPLFPTTVQKSYLRGRLELDMQGNIPNASRINPKKVLSLLIIQGITPIVKRDIALFYGLATAYINIVDIPPAEPFDKDLPLANFMDLNNIGIIESMFALDYIDSQSEKDAAGKIKTLTTGWTIFGKKKHQWKYTVVDLQPFRTVIDRVTLEMNNYANTHNQDGSINAPAGDVSYPLFKYQSVIDEGRDSFAQVTGDLAIWAILSCHKPRIDA